MREVIYNKDNILDKDINKVITRSKVLLINSKNEITLAFSDNVYHFVGGHVEGNETLNETLIREVKEEAGIVLPNDNYKPYFKITQIFKDYPSIGKTNKYEYYYYVIKTDEVPNLNNINLTEEEINENFELRTFHLDEIESVLEETLNWGERNRRIAPTMIEAIRVYKEMNSQKNCEFFNYSKKNLIFMLYFLKVV